VPLTLIAWLGQPASGGDAAKSDVAADKTPVAHVLRTLQQKSWITSLVWSPDGKRLATTGILSPDITVWNPETGEIVRRLTRQRGYGESLAFIDGGRYLLTSAAMDTPGVALSLWDLNTGEITREIDGLFPGKGPAYNGARLFALDPEKRLGVFIPVQRPGQLIGIFDARDWTQKGTLSVPKDIPNALAISPDGKLLAVGTITGRVALFDLASRTLVRTIEAYGPHEAGVASLAFSPDSRFIATGPTLSIFRPEGPERELVAHIPEDPIRIWNVTDGKLARSFKAKLGPVRSLAWSPDGKYLVSGTDDAARLWRVDSESAGIVVTTLPRGGALSVAFSPDGKRLAVCGQSTAVVSEIEQ
jgi:WD40 repeat protein